MDGQFRIPAGRSLIGALLQHARVVHALMLRDIKTRFGASYFGATVGVLFPLAHIGIILSLYIVMGRTAPIGTDVTLYLSTAIVPFVCWSYTHQKVMMAFMQNRSLTAFPIVKLTDIVLARALVELVNISLVVSVTLVALAALGHDLFIQDKPAMLYAVFLAYALGVSTGFLLGLFTILAPPVAVFGFLLIPLYWITSGVFFFPEGLPEQARAAIWIFPLTHIVDFGRTAFYSIFMSDFYSLPYVHAVIVANFLLAMTMERFLRPTLTAK